MEAAVDPEFGELLLHAVLLQAGAEVAPIDFVERLVLIEAGEDHGLFAGFGILVHLQALGADLLHHALHRGVDAADGVMFRLQVLLQNPVAGAGHGGHHAVGADGDDAVDVLQFQRVIVAVGVDDASICRAINLIVDSRGGISCVNDEDEMVLPLPVGGLMSEDDGNRVAELYTLIDGLAKKNGSTLSAPFMTLSFMALLVIPALKLSDKGLFDGRMFRFVQGFEPA